MSITVEEKFGRLLSDRSAELTFIVRGTDEDEDARDALASAAPETHLDLAREEIEVEQIGNDLWLGTVRYAVQDITETGESVFSFDTGGGSQHITQSLQTVASYSPTGQAAPDFAGAIGVSQESVDGVDITVPVYNFTETHYLPEEIVTLAYRGTLFGLTGKVNSTSFKGLNPGECLFLGASGSRRTSGGTSGGGGGSQSASTDWEITYRFAASPNRSNITIGNITGINKKGWEYLWVRYQDVEDTSARMLVKRPAAVYVERVYESADFSLLGIGG